MSTLRTAPWRRAPVLLVRRPVVFLAIVAAAGILAVAAASGPLFLSTIGTASLDSQAGQTCPENTRPGMSATVPATDVAATQRAGQQAMARHDLPRSYPVAVGEARVGPTLVHVFARPGALEHVRRLTPAAGPGVWLPNVFARKIGARAGGTVTTGTGVRLPIAGIYQDLAPDPYSLSHLPTYWCSWTNIIVSTVADDRRVAATTPAFRQGPVFITEDSAFVAQAVSSPVRLSWHADMSTRNYPLGAFDDAARRSVLAAQATSDATGAHAFADSELTDATRRAHTAQQGLTGSIVPIEIAGVLIAALLVAGAGAYWANARSREIRLLVSRGVGPLPLAVKATLETVVPAVLGAGLGFAATIVLVKGVGPASVLESGAPLRALGLVAAAVIGGLALIGVIGALAGRERTSGRQAPWLRLMPWELLLLGGAVVVAVVRLNTSAVAVDHSIVKISALVVLYPLLGATGALLLLGRLVSAMLPALGRGPTRAPNAAYLALRRISRSRAIVIGLIVGTALPCCLLMYGSTVTGTVRDEVTHKYQTNLGAPHVLQVYGVRGRLLDPGGTGTQVVLYEQNATLGGEHVNVLGVDPATFEDFAFTTSDQRDAVSRLKGARTDGTTPAVVVNQQGNASTSLTISRTSLPLHAVARQAVFPGLRVGAFPLVVVNREALQRVDGNTERENQIWTDGTEYGAARRYAEASGFTVLFELTSKVVIGSTGLLPVTWVFGYLRALAVLIGVVAIAGLVFGMSSRTRTRQVSYVLSRRMGMSKLAHVNSLLIELTVVIGFGWLAGSSLGLGSFGFVYKRLDVYPSLPPAVAFAVPSGSLAVSAVVVAVVIVLAALGTHALAERTKPAEILRLE